MHYVEGCVVCESGVCGCALLSFTLALLIIIASCSCVEELSWMEVQISCSGFAENHF